MGLFKGLKPCCGGTAVKTAIIPMADSGSPSSTTSETAYSRREQEEMVVGGGFSHAAPPPVTRNTTIRRSRSTNMTPSRNWKPKLYSIYEDRIICTEEDNSFSQIIGKQKSKIPTKYEDFHRRSASMWAVPSFSPAPFAF